MRNLHFYDKILIINITIKRLKDQCLFKGVDEMIKREYSTEQQVLERGLEAVGKQLKDIDTTGRINIGKGAVGSILEEGWFGYKINSESQPDFPDAGVELKAIPYIYNSKGLRAKERMVCNIINYMEEHRKNFHSSSFWIKCNTILMMSFEYKKDLPKEEYTINSATLFKFPEKDRVIIENDWNKIIHKIKSGKAHEISEGDTLYLGACTKGTNSESVRKQPFSDLPAKQRAYSLKQSYMTYILNKYIHGSDEDENIIKSIEDMKRIGDFESYIENKISKYYGKTQQELKNIFAVKSNAKNINEILIGKILEIDGKISQTEEFKKANIIPKTIRVKSDGIIDEHMSFPTFKFCEIVNEEWDDSYFKNYLEQTKFLFIIFKEVKNEYILDRVMFWNIPEIDLGEAEIVWRKTVDIINKGVKTREAGSRTFNNLPSSKENRVCHVRSHGINKKDAYPLPDGRMLTKQSFWLNNTYIREQIEKGKNI